MINRLSALAFHNRPKGYKCLGRPLKYIYVAGTGVYLTLAS
jgi:hypothetical protein